MQHTRLNNDSFKDDLVKFLSCLKDENVFSITEIKKWIEDYDLQISKNMEILHGLVKGIVPKRYFTITNTEDDNSSFTINVFGCTPEECLTEYYDKTEDISRTHFDNQYVFCLHKVSLGNTIDYYLNELKEAIRLGFITEKDVSEYIIEERKRQIKSLVNK